MSGHPELREEVVAAVQRWADDAGGYAREDIEELAAYLFDRLAGPVGKLQADLAEAQRHPNLGLATTAQLLNELRCRIEVDYFVGGGGLGYTTVGGRPDALLDAPALDAGESAVTGPLPCRCTNADDVCPFRIDGHPQCESAVTGEAT